MESSFKVYLESKGYSTKNAILYRNQVKEYEIWLKMKGYKLEGMDYKKLLEFIGYLQEGQLSKRGINDRLRSVSKYNQYKKVKDVAYDVRLRGETKEQPLLLNEEELEIIYQNWENPTEKGYFCYSNKLMLSLIIYQGVVKKEIQNIELHEVNLEAGTIYIKGSQKVKNGRKLKLESHQILSLYSYIKEKRGITHPLQTGNPKESSKLFSPNCDKEERLGDQFKEIRKHLKKQYETHEIPYRKLQQLQQSRITIWIKQYGLRKAQYLSGFKSINQVEKYRDENTEDLKEQIMKYHPLQ